MSSTTPHDDRSSPDASSGASPSARAAAHRAGDILDVHLLDIAAQLEALLRSVRHVQGGVLRLRGALPATDGSPVEAVRDRLGLMRREWGALGEAIQAAVDAADALADHGEPAEPPDSASGR